MLTVGPDARHPKFSYQCDECEAAVVCHTDLSISYQCDECEAAVVWLSHGLVNLVSVWWVRGCSRLTVTRTCQTRISVRSARMQSSDCHADLSISYQCDLCEAAVVWQSHGLVNLVCVMSAELQSSGCHTDCQSRISVITAEFQSSDCHTDLSISYQCGECGATVVCCHADLSIDSFSSISESLGTR